MKISDLRYDYPPELVAVRPLEKRDESRLMVLNRDAQTIEHRIFSDFPSLIAPGSVLVLNNTKVFPCRLIGKKPTGGRLECLLVREVEPLVWQCLVSSSSRLPKDAELFFSDDLKGILLDAPGGETRLLRLICRGSLEDILERDGHVPLPPYLKRPDENADRARYQTVYAQKVGSVAAPTAGFHLTDSVLQSLQSRGVHVAFVTLHVGLGTFLPVRVEELEEHKMHGEFYEIPEETSRLIQAAKKEGRAVYAVGTTSVRALESAAIEEGVKSGKGFTEIFIYPPYAFKVIDGLLTNFHQPESTLLALVMAFAGKDYVKKVYSEAIREKYRLFSYGDCMWIV